MDLPGEGIICRKGRRLSPLVRRGSDVSRYLLSWQMSSLSLFLTRTRQSWCHYIPRCWKKSSQSNFSIRIIFCVLFVRKWWWWLLTRIQFIVPSAVCIRLSGLVNIIQSLLVSLHQASVLKFRERLPTDALAFYHIHFVLLLIHCFYHFASSWEHLWFSYLRCPLDRY